jgi:hypothetical protein
MVEGAGMDPHALGSHLPGPGDGGDEQVAIKTLADETWQKAELGKLNCGVGLAFEFKITGWRP